MYLLKLAVVVVALAALLAAAGQSVPPALPCELVGALIIKVVPLSYARAGELT